MTRNQPCSRKVTVNLENGLHLKPSSQIVQIAHKFGCKLTVRKGDRTVDGTSMLDLLTLAAEHGTELEFVADGEHAEEVLDALAQLLEQNFETESRA